MKRTFGSVLLLCAFAVGACAFDDRPRPVSRESVEHLKNMRKNPPFGARGFDLAALRTGMGSRHEPTVKDVELIRVKIGPMPCEWVLAEGADPDLRLLYLHGGGFVSGSGAFYLPLAAHISATARCAVLLPDYRLAPEHRFPAGLDDCVRAHDWMMANGPSGPAPAYATFVAGDSAGGCLTLATLLALRDRRMELPAGGIAISPVTDLTLASESLKGVEDPVLHASTMPIFRDHYLGKGDPRNPLASPVFGDYRGVPPLLIQVGEHEMLRDDSVRVAKKARAGGIAVRLEVWAGMFHVFQSREPLLPEGKEAIDHIAEFVRSSVPPRDIGSRRELFVDHYLIERLDGARLEIGRPQPAGVALKYDKPWDGPISHCTTVIKDGDRYRMYYRGKSSKPGYRYTICYAESPDGIQWARPELGLVEIDGSKANNVVLLQNQALAPFLDTRPGVPAAERFKGNAFVETRFGAERDGLLGYVSPDGLHWKPVRKGPIVRPEFKNNFDSQNVMFWSEVEQQYVLYARQSEAGIRAQSRATSRDFLTWTPQVRMTYSDTGTSVPSDQLYISQVQPYSRAPHIYISLPGRLMEGRRALTPEQGKRLDIDPVTGGDGGCSDGVLQTSRAGSARFDRTFREALVRPGPGDGNWVSRTNYPACGIVQTGPAEMSIYVQRHYGLKTAHLERLTLRLDGFASVHALFAGGELLTRPLRFAGSALELNCSTSAAGGIRVEVQDAGGKPIPGYTLADNVEIVGDDVARVVTWKGGADVSKLAGKSVRLRFVMRDADLYSLRFTGPGERRGRR
jgi:acetyl esterase/lipase